jgi:pyruvate formate lyase activating enzyme
VRYPHGKERILRLENGETGMVFNIQRYQIHDGPGIRTIVFLKGCPLGCLWCSNPEGKDVGLELYYLRSRCKLCGRCVEICPQNANAMTEDGILIKKEVCQKCGKCVEDCLYSAREIKGQRMTVDGVVKEVEKDRSFYFTSGGGLTIGGGEPLFQAQFTKNILHKCKSKGIHTAVETSGCGAWKDLEEILPYTDWIFYDLKVFDSQVHKKYTGVSNELILGNARKLSKAIQNWGIHLTVRIPVVPGVNNSKKNITQTSEFVKDHMPSTAEIEILKYHSLALGKYAALGEEYLLANAIQPSEEEMLEIKEWIAQLGLNCRYEGVAAEVYVGVR